MIGAAPRLEDFELPVGLPSARGGFLNPDVYRESSVNLGHTRNGRTLFSRLEAYWRDQEYARSDVLDQRVSGIALGLSRSVRENLALNAYGNLDRRRYLLAAREDVLAAMARVFVQSIFRGQGARLGRATEEKTRFLAAASHDLRQPLHALSLFSADMQRQLRARVRIERRRIERKRQPCEQRPLATPADRRIGQPLLRHTVARVAVRACEQ